MWIKLKNLKNAEERLNQIENKIDPNLVGYIQWKDFSLFIQDLLISEGGYIMDIGNCKNANYVCAYRLLEKIKKHPLIWKLFFMVA